MIVLVRMRVYLGLLLSYELAALGPAPPKGHWSRAPHSPAPNCSQGVWAVSISPQSCQITVDTQYGSFPFPEIPPPPLGAELTDRRVIPLKPHAVFYHLYTHLRGCVPKIYCNTFSSAVCWTILNTRWTGFIYLLLYSEHQLFFHLKHCVLSFIHRTAT